jgi:MFS family permease
MGLGSSSLIVSGLLVIMEFCEPERRPTYIGLANTATGIVSVLAPLGGALLAGVSYGWLFAVTAGFNLAAAIVMHWRVRDPRWAAVLPTAD